MTEIAERFAGAPARSAHAAAAPPAAPASYAGLLGPRWLDLPAAVRRRFGPQAAAAPCRVYAGEVLATELSRAGRVLAQLARLAGGPMPFTPAARGSTVVAVTHVQAFGPGRTPAQVWTRSYARPGRFPQVIQSAKCFAGPTGLEERLGHGLVMRLQTSAEGPPGAAELVFRSAGYRLRLHRFDVALPALLSPGTCEVRHRDEGGGAFTFTLTLHHPVLGRLLRQVARYHDQSNLEPSVEGVPPCPRT